MKFSHRTTSRGNIIEAHLGIFSGKYEAVCPGFQPGESGLIRILGRRFSTILSGWNADVDSRKNSALALHTIKRAFGFAENIIRGQAGLRQFVESLFVRVVQKMIVKLKQFLFREIAKNGRADILNE